MTTIPRNPLVLQQLQAFIGEKLSLMARAPLMYALTKEGFISRVGTLLEILDTGEKFDVFLLAEGSVYAGLRDPLTTDFALRALTKAREILDEALCSTCGMTRAIENTTCSNAFHCCRQCTWEDGVLVKECASCRSTPLPRYVSPPSEVVSEEEAERMMAEMIEQERAYFKGLNKEARLARYPEVYVASKDANTVALDLQRLNRILTSHCRGRYENGRCKLCGGNAMACIPRHVKGKCCAPKRN